jgi:hypothetical protein
MTRPTLDHSGFRSRLAPALLGLLDERERAAFDAHAAACPACSALQEEALVRLPDWVADLGHVPLSALAEWAERPGSLTPLERALVESHLDSCDSCRGDAHELAPGLVEQGARRGVLRAAPASAWWAILGVAGGALATAAGFTIFAPRPLPVTLPSPAPVEPAPSVPTASAPSAREPAALPPGRLAAVRELPARARGSVAERETLSVDLSRQGRFLPVRVPELYLDAGAELVVVWRSPEAAPVVAHLRYGDVRAPGALLLDLADAKAGIGVLELSAPAAGLVTSRSWPVRLLRRR